MKKKLKKLCVVSILLLSLTGCWNYSELNDLAIVTSLGIDKKDDKYLLSLSIANAKSAQISSKEGQSQTTVLEGSGKTISEAFTNIDLKSPKQIYINHLTAIVLSDEVAREGVNKVSDYLLREPESRKKFLLLITKDEEARNVLKILTPLESLVSQSIASNVQEASEYQAMANTMMYSIFISDVIETGIHPVLTSITIEGKTKQGQSFSTLEQAEPDATIKLGPLAIFKDDKLVGFASKEASEGINILLNKTNRANVQIKCDDTYIVSELDMPRAKMKIDLKNNKPQVSFTVQATGSITEVNCNRNLNSEKVIQKIEDDTTEKLKSMIRKGLYIAQKKYKSDVLGIGLAYYHKYPNYYLKHEKAWDHEIFPDIDIKVDAKIKLKTKGSLEQTIRKEEA